MISTTPYDLAAPTADLDPIAERLALLDDAAIDRVVAERVAEAVRCRRIDEAVGWQRARLRAHRLRARATAACRA